MTTAKQLHLRSVADEDNGADAPTALTSIGAMLDAIDIAQFGVSDAVEALKLAYNGSATVKEVDECIAIEAQDHDIVNHLADAAQPASCPRSLTRNRDLSERAPGDLRWTVTSTNTSRPTAATRDVTPAEPTTVGTAQRVDKPTATETIPRRGPRCVVVGECQVRNTIRVR